MPQTNKSAEDRRDAIEVFRNEWVEFKMPYYKDETMLMAEKAVLSILRQHPYILTAMQTHADNTAVGLKMENERLSTLLKSAAVIVEQLHRSHRSIMKGLDVSNDDKCRVLNYLGISCTSIESH